MDPMEESTLQPESESGHGGSKAPRLYIKEMIMRNFKSYAGEQRVGPFHKSFSAVVGPNGSGKSNVIDAMLFVFGKRAKQMRLNKVSELIHNSTNHQNLDSAGVSVQFQEIVDLDDGTYEPVSGTDFVITRVAFRDNSSKYYINNRLSNFTEVTKKLKAKGVDLDNNRFLILQGEVEQISLMKPKSQGPHDEGFLEYLEDIIGTNKYVEKIDESYKELESLNESRSSVVQMVKLAEKERDGLEDVKNEAEDYMLKELSLLKWQEIATNLAYEDTSLNMTKQQENVLSLEESLKTEKEKIKENNQTLKELESVHKKHTKRQEELDSQLKDCKDKFKDFERQDVKYREDLKYMKQKIKKLEDKLEKDASKIESCTKESETSKIVIPKLEEEIPKLQKLLLEEEKVLENIKEKSKDETEGYRSELAKVRVELEPWETKLTVHKGNLEVASSQRKHLSEKHEAARTALTDAQKHLNDLSGRLETKTVAVDDMREKLEVKKDEALEARKVEQECVKEQDKLIPLEQVARQKVAELRASVDSEKSQGAVLKAILRAKESNQIEGIYGRLGDLGAVEKKYDVAVSTACGGLDNIIVETSAAAEACVGLLRRENIGVGSFLILEKQNHLLQKSKATANNPEGVPRLFDLIRVQDEKLKLAFYSGCLETVVAKDLEQARRLAFDYGARRRVVTLDGDLIETSGTMTGGGKPRRGKIGTSIRAASVSGETVAKAEKELAEMVSKLNSFRQKTTEAVKHYQIAEKEVTHLQMEIAKGQQEIDSFNSEYNYLKNQMDSLEAASKPKKDELVELEKFKKIILAEKEEIDQLTLHSKPLKERALMLQSKLENIGGEKLKAQKLKVDKIQSDIDKNSTDINRRKVQIETSEKMVKKLTKGIEDSTKEKERLTQEKEKLGEGFKEIEQKAFSVQEKYKETQKLIDQHKDVLDAAKSNHEKLKKSLDELRASEVDTEYKLQDMKKLYKELEMKERGYKKRLGELQMAVTKQMEQIQKDLVDADKLQATLTEESLTQTCDLKKSLEMVALLEAQLKEMNPNLDSIAEYRSKVALYTERVEELNNVTLQRDNVKQHYDDLRKKRLDEFMAGFNAISLKLKEMYQMITLGGDAELELVDSLDPFSEGVVFSVRPPKKSWKNIANLSGGEKTLSSLALIFALHHYKPTPLYVMDEIDAALDFKNVSIVGHYVKDRTKNAQFIIISLRNNMFELADRLVGIYKTDNCTKSITINPGSFVVCEKAV